MAYELYWISGSPYAWRVQLGFELKGIAYQSHRLNAGEGEHKSADYLAINPRGKVPALKDGDTIICESTAILAYLEAKHPEKPLFGTDPAAIGQIWQTLNEVDSFVQQPVQQMIRPIFFGQLPDKNDDVIAQAKLVHEELVHIERRLGASEYLVGSAITAADVALLPAIQGLLRGVGKDEAAPLELGFLPFAETYPNITAWGDRMELIPGYEKAFPPHWL